MPQFVSRLSENISFQVLWHQRMMKNRFKMVSKINTNFNILLKMLQNDWKIKLWGPSWRKLAQRCANMGQLGANMAHLGSNLAELASNLGQLEAKMGPSSLQDASRRRQVGLSWSNLAPTWANLTSTWRILGPTWLNLFLCEFDISQFGLPELIRLLSFCYHVWEPTCHHDSHRAVRTITTLTSWSSMSSWPSSILLSLW